MEENQGVTSGGQSVFIDGLAYDGTTLYGFAHTFNGGNSGSWDAADFSTLVAINPTNGVATPVGSALSGYRMTGAAFDNNSQLWAYDNVRQSVFAVNTSNGSVSSQLAVQGLQSGRRFHTDIVFDSNNDLYITHDVPGGSYAVAWRINKSNGALTNVLSDSRSQADEPSGLAFSPTDSSILYFAEAQHTDILYTYNISGGLGSGFVQNTSPISGTLGFQGGLGDLASAAFVEPPASLTAGPNPLDFGYVLVNDSKSLDVTVGNDSATRSLAATLSSGNSAITPAQSSVSGVTAGNPATVSITYAPTVTGNDDTSLTVDAGAAGSEPLTVEADAVAPILEVLHGVDAVALGSTIDIGPVRIGDTGSVTLTIKNDGQGNLASVTGPSTLTANGIETNLDGTIGAASGAFSGSGGTIFLGDGDATPLSYSFTPTSAGPGSTVLAIDFANGSPNGENDPIVADSLTLMADAVGPVLQLSDSAPTPLSDGQVIDVGFISPFTGFDFGLQLENLGALGYAQSLTGLTITDIGIEADFFTLAGLAANDVVMPEDPTLFLTLTPNAPIAFASNGRFAIDLVLTTDQGGAFGSPTSTFTLTFVGESVIPLPATALLLLSGLALMPLRSTRHPAWKSSRAALLVD